MSAHSIRFNDQQTVDLGSTGVAKTHTRLRVYMAGYHLSPSTYSGGLTVIVCLLQKIVKTIKSMRSEKAWDQ